MRHVLHYADLLLFYEEVRYYKSADFIWRKKVLFIFPMQTLELLKNKNKWIQFNIFP